jgi:hypothetical protein
MYCMPLKVYTCEEAARGPKTFLNIFCNKMNLPQPDSGPDSNINSPYCTIVKHIRGGLFRVTSVDTPSRETIPLSLHQVKFSNASVSSLGPF